MPTGVSEVGIQRARRVGVPRQRVLQIDADACMHLVRAGARIDMRGGRDRLRHVDRRGDVVADESAASVRHTA